jgi:D-alanyl-D-alanine carboxypeptidase (penicillin-binding protein 5/6)
MATALVVADEASFRELVRVSSSAAAVGGGGLDLSEGDVASVRDLLYALLLDSSNEAAVALAEHVSGDVGDFVRRMNRMVRDLGTSDTRFTNPHGLDQTGHASTAADLAVIGQRVLATPRLATIVASPAASISVNGSTRAVENRNVLLESYIGAVGIKTGRTLGAGEVLVAAARRGPHGLIAVAMRSADAAADARRLLDAGFAELRERARREKRAAERAAANPEVLLNERQSVGALVFDPAGATEVIAGEEVTGSLPDGVVAAEYRFTPSDRLLLPLTEGEEIGSVEVMAGDVVVATVPALAQDAVMIEESSWAERAFSGILRTAAIVMGGVGA